MLVYMFPGQGAQRVNMGATLFADYPALVAKADQLLGYSIEELCNDSARLNKTEFTQPALFVVSVLHYLALQREHGQFPDYILGHSVGEYAALHAAGAFNFETGLQLVQRRGQLMSQAQTGGMAAVIGLQVEKIMQVIRQNDLLRLDVANYNTPLQTVISGPHELISEAKSYFETAGAKAYVPLRVSGAFHSRYMEPAKKAFSEFVTPLPFAELTIPVISNITARPYDAQTVKQYLCEQLTSPVRWLDSVRHLKLHGATTDDFVEVGSSTVLTKMLAKIDAEEEKPHAPVTNQFVSYSHSNGNGHVNGSHKERSSVLIAPAVNQPYIARNGSTAHPKQAGEQLGAQTFRTAYNSRYACLIGGLHNGVTSADMIVKLRNEGLMGYLGTGGLTLPQIEQDIRLIQASVKPDAKFGVGWRDAFNDATYDHAMANALSRANIRFVEASGFVNMTAGLVSYRLQGLQRNERGEIFSNHRVLGRCARAEVATAFFSPPPQRLVDRLLAEGRISPEQARWSQQISMADDVCIDSTAGSYYEPTSLPILLTGMIRLKQEIAQRHPAASNIHIGVSGGLGTPEAVGVAFMLGADFVATDVINQCSQEAATSADVKQLLQSCGLHDTTYASTEYGFEAGLKRSVLKRSTFFPVRANKLYSLYRQLGSLQDLAPKLRHRIEDKYFGRSFDTIEAEIIATSGEREWRQKSPHSQMSRVFRWYLDSAPRWAIEGDADHKVNYHIDCAPEMGACNQWLLHSSLEDWQQRSVSSVTEKLMEEAAEFLNRQKRTFFAQMS